MRRTWKRWMIRLGLAALMWIAWAAICPDAFAGDGARETTPVVSGIDIEIMGAAGDAQRLERIARRLIHLRKGDRFTPEKLKESIDSLSLSRLFRSIHVPDPLPGESEIALLFRLTPFGRIRDIKIHGAFPVFERELLDAMTIFTGDAFVPEELSEQEGRIAKVFTDQGYLSPKIEVTAEKIQGENDHVVTVIIEKGDYYRIRNVSMEGNRAFSGARLKLRIDTWKSSLFFGGIRRFISSKLEKDVRNLTDFYRRKGYADVRIESRVENEPDSRGVNITIAIQEGPLYEIGFSGNREFRGRTLKKDLVLAGQGNKGDLGLRKSIRNMRERYRKAGYLHARVSMEEKKREDNIRKILLVIEEGPRSVVSSVEIRGNEYFNDEKIAKQMVTRPPGTFSHGAFVPEALEEDLVAIQSLYLKNGYRDIGVKEKIRWRIDSVKKETAAGDKGKPAAAKKEAGKKETGSRIRSGDLVIEVTEGQQSLVTSVAFRGLTVLEQAEAKGAIALKAGEPFRKYMIESDENILSAMISERGYPHVGVTGRVKMDDNGTHAAVTYEIDEGPFVTMGEVWYTGNFRTREEVMGRELTMAPGDRFSLTKMLETQRNIRTINALDAANFKVLGLNEKADTVNLLVEVAEKKPWFVEAGAGYDTRREFYVNTKAGDRNLLGRNMDGWVAGEYSRIGYRGELEIAEPRLFGSRIRATLNLFAEEEEELNQEFGVRSYGATMGFGRKFLGNFNAGLSFRYESREQFSVGEETGGREDQEIYDPRAILVATPSITYDSTDSFTRPTKGLRSSLSMDISRGFDNSLDDFLRHRFEVRYYYTPVKRLTLALRGRYYRIDAYGDDDRLPDDQLFFLGGISDIRGFDENMLRFDAAGDPLGGHTSILGTLEARIDLGANFELTTFYDIGSIRDTEAQADEEEFRSSAGLGIRYITPIGPVGFLYGWNLDPEEKESSGKLHFTLGYTF